MWEWSDKLKLGKSSAFVKRDLRLLPLTEAEFEADFFLEPKFSTRRQEIWMGMVVEREVRRPAGDGRRAYCRRPPSTILRRSWPMPCNGRRIMKTVSVHARSTFGIVPNGRNCCLIFGNLALRSSWATICRGSMKLPLTGCNTQRRRSHLPRTQSKLPLGSRSRSENAIGSQMRWL